MDNWLVFFVALTAVALLAQAVVLLLTFLRLRRLHQQVADLLQQLNDRIDPLLYRLEDIVRNMQTNSLRILDDVAAIANTARGQAEKFDQVTDDLTLRLRRQIIRLDELLGRAVDALETVGEKVGRTLAGPVREAVAVVHGVRTALDFLAQRRAANKPAEPGAKEEELFI